MRCFYCGCTAFTPGRFLHRISKKGEAGVFACNLCIKEEDKEKTDPVITDICERLAGIKEVPK